MKSSGSVVAKSSLSTLIKPVQLHGAAGAPAEFVLALANFLTEQSDLDAVRRQIARILMTSLEPCAAIEGVLKVACNRGELAQEDYGILLADLKRITTEETPTDVRIAGDNDRAAESNSTARVSPETNAEYQEPELPHVGGRRPVQDSIEPEIGSVLNDRYQLEELVASGPMGSVFRAADRFKQHVGADPALAIKMLNPDEKFGADAVVRLQQEAFQVQRLSHPNIINIYDFDQAQTLDFITMEWLEGESLAALLDRHGSHPLEMSEVRRIVAGAAAGLSFAHARGIVHGDVKPANIYLCSDGGVKIIDFGVVRGPVVKAGTDDVAAYAVTPGYASCELLEGREPCVQDDVYALACTVFRMVAGFRPHGRQTALQAASGSRELRRPQELTDPQWQVLQRGLALRRSDRLPDVDAFAEVFTEATKAIRTTGWVKPALVALVVGLSGGAAIRYGFEALGPLTQQQVIPRAASISSSPVPREPVVVDDTGVVGVLSGTDAQSGDDRLLPQDQEIRQPLDSGQTPSSPVFSEPFPAAEFVPPVLDDPADFTRSLLVESATGMVREVENDGVDSLPSGVTQERRTVGDVFELPAADPVAFSGPTGFTVERFDVGESAGFVQLVVRAPPDLVSELRIRLIVEPGAAISGQDFMPPARDQLEFSPGHTEEIVIIPLISDAISEHTEDLTVRLESLDVNYALENVAALIVIIDDD